MPTLKETAQVAEYCQTMAKSLLEGVETLPADLPDLRFSSAWDGLYEHTAAVDMVMHSYSMKLLQSSTVESLKKLLLADCARALVLREEMQERLKQEMN